MARAAKGEGTLFKTEKGYRGYVTVNGKRKYFSAPNKTAAARAKRLLLDQRDKGELSAGRSPKLDDWLDHWMTITGGDRKSSTNATYTQLMNTYIRPALGNKRLDKLTMDDLELFYVGLEKSGLSGSIRHQCHSIIRVALKHAVWRGHVGRNVAALVKPPTPASARAKALSEEDLRALYQALSGDRFEARWHLSLGMGLRPGEAIALEWKHVDFETATIRVEQQILQVSGRGAVLEDTTKTKAGGRVISLPPYLLALLADTRARQLKERAAAGKDWVDWEPDGQPHSFCFTRTDGSVIRPGYDTTLWKKLLERAGLPHTRRYTARHTAASMLISDGADIPAVAEMMGHANPAMTMAVYTHAVAERKVALADRAAARFADLAAPYPAPYDPLSSAAQAASANEVRGK